MGGKRTKTILYSNQDYLDALGVGANTEQPGQQATPFYTNDGTLDFGSTLRGEQQYDIPETAISRPSASDTSLDMTKPPEGLLDSWKDRVSNSFEAKALKMGWGIAKGIGEAAIHPVQTAQELGRVAQNTPEQLGGFFQKKAADAKGWLNQSGSDEEGSYNIYLNDEQLAERDAERQANLDMAKYDRKQGGERMASAIKKADAKLDFTKAIQEAIPSTVDSALGVGMGFVNPMLGLTYMGASQGFDSYMEGREKGMSETQANLHGFMSGMAEGGFEFLPMGYAISAIKAKRYGAAFAKQAAAEIGTEIPTTIVQSGSERLFTDKGSLWNYLSGKEKSEDGKSSAIYADIDSTIRQTLAQTFMMGMAGKVLNSAGKLISKQDSDAVKWTDEQTEEYGKFVSNLAGVAELKARGADPGVLAIPKWLIETYPGAIMDVMGKFKQKHGYIPLSVVDSGVQASSADNTDIDLTTPGATSAQSATPETELTQPTAAAPAETAILSDPSAIAARQQQKMADPERRGLAMELSALRNQVVQPAPEQVEQPQPEPPPAPEVNTVETYQQWQAQAHDDILKINDKIAQTQNPEEMKVLQGQLRLAKAREKSATDNINRLNELNKPMEGGDTNGLQGNEVSTQEGNQEGGQGLLTPEVSSDVPSAQTEAGPADMSAPVPHGNDTPIEYAVSNDAKNGGYTIATSYTDGTGTAGLIPRNYATQEEAYHDIPNIIKAYNDRVDAAKKNSPETVKIADELRKLGEHGRADAMIAAASQVTPNAMAIHNNSVYLARVKRQKSGTPVTDILRDKFSIVDRIGQHHPADAKSLASYMLHEGADKEVIKSADEASQQILAKINDLGFKLDEIDPHSAKNNPEVLKLQKAYRDLVQGVIAFYQSHAADLKKYKRSKPERTAEHRSGIDKAIANANAVLGVEEAPSKMDDKKSVESPEKTGSIEGKQDHTVLKAPYIDHLETALVAAGYDIKTISIPYDGGEKVQTQIYKDGKYLLVLNRTFHKDHVDLSYVFGKATKQNGDPTSEGALDKLYEIESAWMKQHAKVVKVDLMNQVTVDKFNKHYLQGLDPVEYYDSVTLHLEGGWDANSLPSEDRVLLAKKLAQAKGRAKEIDNEWDVQFDLDKTFRTVEKWGKDAVLPQGEQASEGTAGQVGEPSVEVKDTTGPDVAPEEAPADHLLVDLDAIPDEIPGLKGHSVFAEYDGEFDEVTDPNLKEQMLEKQEVLDILQKVLDCVRS